jgi:hypothetical protein
VGGGLSGVTGMDGNGLVFHIVLCLPGVAHS